jgi:hypothetical protein
MKKILLVSLAVILTLSSFAQEKTKAVKTEKNTLKLNTLALFAITPTVFYERKISDLISAQLGVGYVGAKYSSTKLSGLILTPELRIYPKKAAIDGMYVAPYLRYANWTLENSPAKATLTRMGGGLLLGRQWVTNSGFTMGLFFGGQYTGSKLKVSAGTDSDFNSKLLSGFGVRVGFSLGFAF